MIGLGRAGTGKGGGKNPLQKDRTSSGGKGKERYKGVFVTTMFKESIDQGKGDRDNATVVMKKAQRKGRVFPTKGVKKGKYTGRSYYRARID